MKLAVCHGSEYAEGPMKGRVDREMLQLEILLHRHCREDIHIGSAHLATDSIDRNKHEFRVVKKTHQTKPRY